MKKAWHVFGILALIAIGIFGIRKVSQARVTTANSTDIWCVGPSGTEVCVDSSANLIPTTTATGALGTASLQWSGLQVSGNGAIGGTLAVTGAVTNSGATTSGAVGTANAAGSGNATAPSANTIIGSLVLQPKGVGTGTGATTGILVSTTVPVLATYETLISSGNDITITATPSISTLTAVGGTTAITDGTYLILSSTSTQLIKLQDNGTLSGSLLYLGSTSRTVGNHKVLTLIFNKSLGFWTEVSYANNN